MYICIYIIYICIYTHQWQKIKIKNSFQSTHSQYCNRGQRISEVFDMEANTKLSLKGFSFLLTSEKEYFSFTHHQAEEWCGEIWSCSTPVICNSMDRTGIRSDNQHSQTMKVSTPEVSGHLIIRTGKCLSYETKEQNDGFQGLGRGFGMFQLGKLICDRIKLDRSKKM